MQGRKIAQVWPQSRPAGCTNDLSSSHSDSQSYCPDFHQMRKLDLPLTARRVKIGVWSCQENKIYLEFLRKNKNDFASEVARRSSKVFYYLSKALKKRTPDQCRSHHQKLQMRISNIEDIIAYVERKSLGYPRVPKRDKKTSHPEQTHEGPIHSWCVPTYDKICLKLAINFESLNYL